MSSRTPQNEKVRRAPSKSPVSIKSSYCKLYKEYKLNLGLRGKRALVTASTAGIGFAIARSLATEGASVWINGRTQTRVDAALGELDGQVQGVAADLSTAEGCNKIFEALPDLDILVNNLGIFEMRPFLEIKDEEWVQTFNVNVLSGIRITRRYLPGMLQRRWGRLLFISSDSGIQVPPEAVHYGVSKAAQFALVRGIAETIPDSGVTVNSLIPGPTDSEQIGNLVETFSKELGVTTDQFKKDLTSSGGHSNLIRRFAKAEEVAAMATYLCSEVASATTGSPIRVDGGVLRSAF
jgi:NAD(P)-dependent dehydrogenase (short-subunit alcohol dehydrogenase family)